MALIALPELFSGPPRAGKARFVPNFLVHYAINLTIRLRALVATAIPTLRDNPNPAFYYAHPPVPQRTLDLPFCVA